MLSHAAQKYVRYAEVAIVAVLGIIAFVTWRELSDLRKAPVALPNYEFETIDGGNVVQTRGTWFSDKGVPDSLQTTTLECRKPSMRCVESAAAVVFVEGKGVLESRLTEFEVERWADKEIVAKPYTDRCMTRTLSLDLVQKRARSHVNPVTDDSGRCRPQRERSLELVAGYKFREQHP